MPDSHETYVVVSSLHLAILGLGEVGQEEFSNKLLFVPLLGSSSLGCTNLLPKLSLAVVGSPQGSTCGVKGFNFVVVLRKICKSIVRCIYFAHISLVASVLRLHREKISERPSKQFRLLMICINQVFF